MVLSTQVETLLPHLLLYWRSLGTRDKMYFPFGALIEFRIPTLQTNILITYISRYISSKGIELGERRGKVLIMPLIASEYEMEDAWDMYGRTLQSVVRSVTPQKMTILFCREFHFNDTLICCRSCGMTHPLQAHPKAPICMTACFQGAIRATLPPT